jgi:acetyl-CoA carboxylase biotin carboxyl carrier protein
VVPPSSTTAGYPADSEGEIDVAEDTPEVASPGIRIEAPIMGVFYRSASPADPPFVEVGDSVEVGQVVGLIEAMKVFSEVKSESAGTVRAIPTTNRALVQPGDALMILDTE